MSQWLKSLLCEQLDQSSYPQHPWKDWWVCSLPVIPALEGRDRAPQEQAGWQDQLHGHILGLIERPRLNKVKGQLRVFPNISLVCPDSCARVQVHPHIHKWGKRNCQNILFNLRFQLQCLSLFSYLVNSLRASEELTVQSQGLPLSSVTVWQIQFPFELYWLLELLQTAHFRPCSLLRN